jgi:GNAT superfamily N-acetyltransferase
VTEPEIAELAALHRVCLAGSLVAALGPRYVRSFYRYVTRSDREATVVDRDADGRIAAAAVVSLDPSTFNRRLLFHTSLAMSVTRHAGVMVSLVASGLRRPGCVNAGPVYDESAALPEMILLYAAPGERRRGRGRSVVARVEHRLAELGVPEYCVRTVLDPANGALAFYRQIGFAPIGTSVRFGTCFQVFTRAVHAGDARPRSPHGRG